jgi:hypothetical protein
LRRCLPTLALHFSVLLELTKLTAGSSCLFLDVDKLAPVFEQAMSFQES